MDCDVHLLQQKGGVLGQRLLQDVVALGLIAGVARLFQAARVLPHCPLQSQALHLGEVEKVPPPLLELAVLHLGRRSAPELLFDELNAPVQRVVGLESAQKEHLIASKTLAAAHREKLLVVDMPPETLELRRRLQLF